MENQLKQQVLDLQADRLSTHYLYSDFLSDCHFFNSLIRRFRWDW
jgi:hypothetical protein